MNDIIGAEIILAVVGLVVVIIAKEKWSKSIKRKYELFPKKLNIEISTQDVGLGSYLFDAKDRLESGKTQKTLSKEVKIRYEGEQIALAETAPTIDSRPILPRVSLALSF